MNDLKIIIIALLIIPLITSSISIVGNRVLSRNIINTIIVFLFTVACILSSYILIGFINNKFNLLEFNIYIWGTVNGKALQFGILLDELNALLLAIVSYISFAVHIYSISYMKNDNSYYRFFSYISFFTFAMFVLVISNNFLQLFFAWEMVGLASYILIGFWFTSNNATRASFKALLINRISDVAFLVAILMIFYYFDSLNYIEIFSESHKGLLIKEITIFPNLSCPVINIICILLLIGALGKSAQLPFCSWLPDSMAGPVPVSALIHAATMVAAGIFMIARLSPLFELSKVSLNIMLIIGVITCVSMGLVAVVLYDLKRILAYSTISQLGLMLAALGASSYSASIFHLTIHAFFKALLFLGAGVVITSFNQQQDFRKFHGFNICKIININKIFHDKSFFRLNIAERQILFIYIIMLVASLAAVGFPGISGFYSKELIFTTIKNSIIENNNINNSLYYLLLFSIFVTSLYTFRMFFMVFYRNNNISDNSDLNIDNARFEITVNTDILNNSKQAAGQPLFIKFPLTILAIFTIAVGWVGILLLRDGFLQNILPEQIQFTNYIKTLQDKTIIWILTLHGFISIPFFLVVLGGVVAWFGYARTLRAKTYLSKLLKPIYIVLNNEYWFDAINEFIVVVTRKKVKYA